MEPNLPSLGTALKVAALILVLAGSLAPMSGQPGAPRGGYHLAIVEDVATGRVLFENRADDVSPPASMTKLMTFAVLEDRIRSGALSLQTQVTVTAADARVGALRDSTSVWLKTGERFPIEELIYAMMIQSANDAAYAVANEVSGSIPPFVALMNAKARELGMTHTTFRTPNGLPVPSHRIADGDLTTPRDFALLCRYLLLHTDILKYTSVKTRLFGSGVRFPATQMSNHNNLLGRVPGVDGLKTGFTTGAGYCIAATAERGGRRVIAVVMDCPWPQRDRDLETTQLIDRAFLELPTVGSESAAPSEPPAISPAPIPSSYPPSPPSPSIPPPAIRFPAPGAVP